MGIRRQLSSHVFSFSCLRIEFRSSNLAASDFILLAPNSTFLCDSAVPVLYSRKACLLCLLCPARSLLPWAHSLLRWILEKGLEVLTLSHGAHHAACRFLRFLTLQLLCFPIPQNSAEMSLWCGYVLCSLCVSGDPGPCVNWTHAGAALHPPQASARRLPEGAQHPL